MGSHSAVNDDFFALEVEEDDLEDEEHMEIIHEEHVRIEPEPEWDNIVQNDDFHCDIQIKQEIDFEDNYIEDGEYIDFDNIETEIDLNLQENGVGIEAEAIECRVSEYEEKVESLAQEHSIEEENPMEDRKTGENTEVCEEGNIKTVSLEEENTGDSLQLELASAKKEERENKVEVSAKAEITDNQKTKEDCTQKEETIKEDGVKGEETIKEDGVQEEEAIKEDGVQEEETIKEETETSSPKVQTISVKENDVVKAQPNCSIEKEKQILKKTPNTNLNKENVTKTKPRNNRSPSNQKQKFHSSPNHKQPLDRRKPYKNNSKNNRHHSLQNNKNTTFWDCRKNEWNQRRHYRGSNNFYNSNREMRYPRFNNRVNRPYVPNQWQNTSPDWQIYETILGVLNQALGQQMPQYANVDERSLVPYSSQNRRDRRMKKSRLEQPNNRPNVWTNGFENVNAPPFENSVQFQTYTNILQAFSQISNGGLMQNNVNNVKVQMSFLNVFQG